MTVKVRTILLEMKHCRTSQLTTSQTLRARQPTLRIPLSLTGISFIVFRTSGFGLLVIIAVISSQVIH